MTEPEPELLANDCCSFNSMSKQDQECLTFVNVEAFALGKCAQRTMRELAHFKNEEKIKLSEKIIG